MRLKAITLTTFWGLMIVPFVFSFFVTKFLLAVIVSTCFILYLAHYSVWALYISRNTTGKVKDSKNRKKMKTYVTVYLAAWVIVISITVYLDVPVDAGRGRYPELEFIGSIAGWAVFFALCLVLNFAAYLIALKENAPGADRTNNRIVTVFKLFMIPFFVNGMIRRIKKISSSEQNHDEVRPACSVPDDYIDPRRSAFLRHPRL
ncbi:MAG: hypothetical protein GDA35_09965 [Hyphomonadaceae bacterium]|nr:hypothetical protein [Hyphomonadaceae bacterium]